MKLQISLLTVVLLGLMLGSRQGTATTVTHCLYLFGLVLNICIFARDLGY